jgi:soluble lytic murein transglycosylase-like protein
MIAWVTLNKDDVIDWVEAEVFLPSQFYEKIEWNWWTDNDENIDERVEEKADNLNYWVDLNENQKNIIKWELESVKSPITTDNIIQSSINYNIPIEYIMAIIKNDSTYWTLW